jgi:hypothetical protein
MKFVDEFRDGALGQKVAAQILGVVEPGRHYKVMEVCGGHTHSIYRYGVDDLLPENVELVHGPGCPVCVIPMGRVDDGIAIARQPGVIFTCFGDMLRVRMKPWSGPVYGVLVWIGFDAVAAPLLGIERNWPKGKERAVFVADHALFGLVLSELRARPRE